MLWTFDASEGPDGTGIGRVIDLALRDEYVFALWDGCHFLGELGVSGGGGGGNGGDEDHIYTVVRIDNKVWRGA